jgi:hypothetical protein
VGAGIWNGTETPPVSIRASRFIAAVSKKSNTRSWYITTGFYNPPFILYNLGSQKSNTEFWYITMVLKKSSTGFGYITMVHNCFWKSIKYLPRTACL